MFASSIRLAYSSVSICVRLAVLLISSTVFSADDRLCTCQVGEYCDSSSTAQLCKPCDSFCGDEGCYGPGSSKCINCKKGSYKSADDKTCDGYICHSACNLNYGCRGPLPEHCEVCKSGYYRAPGSDTCTLKPCDAGYYRHPDSERCHECHVSCASSYGCDGPNNDNCKQCKRGYYRPTGTNLCNVMDACHEACIGCHGPDIRQCKACKEGYFKFPGLQPCIECHQGCKNGCTGISPAECKDCAVGYVRIPTIGCVDASKCWSTCDPVHGCDGPGPDQCRKCRRGFYKPLGEKTCKELTCHESCDPYKGCTGPQSVDCKACKKGYFRLSLRTACVACHEMCDIEKGCDGTLVTNCIACKPGYKRESSTSNCIISDECHDSCDPTEGCDGPFPEQCKGCRDGYHKVSETKACVINPCPIETYCAEQRDYSYQCRACDESCVLEKGCDGPLPMQCRVCRPGYIRDGDNSPCLARITWRETRSVGKRFIFIVADIEPNIKDGTEANLFVYTPGYAPLVIDAKTTQVSRNEAKSRFLNIVARSMVFFPMAYVSEYFLVKEVPWSDLIFELTSDMEFGATLLVEKSARYMGAMTLLPVAYWGDKYICLGIKRSQNVYILSEQGGNEIKVECSHFKHGYEITIPYNTVRSIYVDVCKTAHSREHVYMGIALVGKLPFGVITVEKLDHAEAFCEDVETFIGQDMPMPMRALGKDFITINSKHMSVNGAVVVQALNPYTGVTVYLNDFNAVRNYTLFKLMDILTIDPDTAKDRGHVARRITSSLPVQVYFFLRPPCSWDPNDNGDLSHTILLPDHLFYNEYFVGTRSHEIPVNVTVILVMTVEGRATISVNQKYIDNEVKWERVIGKPNWYVGEYGVVTQTNIFISSHMFGAYVYGVGYQQAFLYAAGYQSCYFGSSDMNPAHCEWADNMRSSNFSVQKDNNYNNRKQSISGQGAVSLAWVLWMVSTASAFILKLDSTIISSRRFHFAVFLIATVVSATFAEYPPCWGPLKGCLLGQYCDPYPRVQCKPCDTSCGDEGCSGPGPDKCKNCQPGQYKPPGEYPCTDFQCHVSCDRSQGCSGPHPDHCTVCHSEYYRPPGSNACTLKPCDTGYYRDNKSDECTECHESCAAFYGCDGPNTEQCRQCRRGYYRPLNSRICTALMCHDTCDKGCYGPEDTQCKECKVGYFKLFGYQPCIDCNQACKNGCTGPLPGDCVDCADGYSRLPGSLTCVDALQCHVTCDEFEGCTGPAPEQCRKCKRGYYKRRGASVCTELKCHETCDPIKGCHGPDPNECKACKKGYYRLSLKDGCSACHDTCDIDKGCEGPSYTECIACKAGYTRAEGSMKCTVSDGCHDSCDPSHGCFGPFPEQCNGCRQGYHKLSKSKPCVSKRPCSFPVNPCPVETYCVERADYSYDCKECHESCNPEKGCDGPLHIQCRGCRPGYQKKPGRFPCQACRHGLCVSTLTLRQVSHQISLRVNPVCITTVIILYGVLCG